MKSVSKLLALLSLALIFGANVSIAHAQQSDEMAYPAPHLIESRQVHTTHYLNRMTPVSQIDIVIQFDTNSTKLAPTEEKKLKAVAAILKSPQFHGCHVAVQGFTDSKGNDAHNQRLSYHRAVQVMHTLVQQYGVPAAMLSAQGFGKENPVADNTTATGRALNRRVSFSTVKGN